MKHLKYYMSMIAGLLAMLTACTNDMVENGPSELWEKQGNEYTITTYVGIPSYEENQTITRSQTYGNEGIDRAEDIHLFCFDKDGFFLGLAKDLTLETTPKGDILENGSSNPKGIKATIQILPQESTLLPMLRWTSPNLLNGSECMRICS